MKEDFKLNVFFSQEGEEIETILANYLIQILQHKNENRKYNIEK